MKKLLSLATLMLFVALGANAQGKKTWDFTQGLSPETVENLNADATNWAANGTNSEGVTNNWKNHAKHSATEPWKANGNIIPELAGLLINIGSNGDNSLHLAQDKMRLTRNNTVITFPNLANGQTITIVGRSANGDAGGSGAHRYIEPSYSYLTLIDGVQTDGKCSFLGNKVEGSLGTYTFKWQVVTDSKDSVEVAFKLPSAGIDFTLFMIDNGDEVKAASITYLYNGTEDAVYNYLANRENTELKAINVTSESVTAETLQDNEVTIVGANVPVDNAAVAVVKEAMPWTPILNLNANLYAAWGYGESTMTGPFAKVLLKNNTLLKNVQLEESEGITALIVGDGESPLPAVTLGDYFAGDPIVAATISEEGEEAQTMIHTHNINHNGYVFLPYTAAYSEAMLKVLDNAIVALQNSKREITAATAPTLSREYKDMKTNVTIALPQLPKARAFYTTDGSEPTTESTPYEGTFTLDRECTVKAVAIAEGYTLSNVAELAIELRHQPATPAISFEQEEAKTTVTLTFDYAEADNVEVWYNFDNTTDTLKSSKYIEPFVINMPQNVTAFAVANQEVWSEVATQRVLVKNPRVVIDVAAHFAATKWDDVANGGGIFSNGKTATSMYDTTQDPVDVVYDDEGNENPVYPEVEWMERDEPGTAPQWKVMTKGQSMLWQNLTARTDQIGTNEGGYFPSVAEDIDPLFPISNYDVQFYNIMAGEQPNGAIQSKNTYKAPLDIVVIANMQGGPLVAQVSADGETWTTIGDEIAKTGLSRMWKKYTRAYEGTDEVYVRVAQLSGSFGAKVFDIYVANQGEESQKLLQQLNEEFSTGISDIQHAATANTGIYNLKGMQQRGLQRGLNIVVASDGSVKKVLVK